MADDPEKETYAILDEIERSVSVDKSRRKNALVWIILICLIFLIILTMLGGMNFLTEKSKSFSNNKNVRVTLLKNQNFLLEYELENKKEFRLYDPSNGNLKDLSKGNKFLRAVYEGDNGFIFVEEITGETKIKYEEKSKKIITIDSLLFTSDVERQNNEIYYYCPWSEIKPFKQKIAFFVCSSKKSKLITITLNATLNTDSIGESISENTDDGRIVEWIDEDRILFSKINSKEDINIIEHYPSSKASNIIYGYW